MDTEIFLDRFLVSRFLCTLWFLISSPVFYDLKVLVGLANLGGDC